MQLGASIGGLIPDLAKIHLLWTSDFNMGKLFRMPRAWRLADTITHTITFWIIVMIIALIITNKPLRLFIHSVTVGALIHIVEDALTHFNYNLPKYYLWPLMIDVPKYIGVIDYRSGSLYPGIFEWIIMILCLLVIVLSWSPRESKQVKLTTNEI